VDANGEEALRGIVRARPAGFLGDAEGGGKNDSSDTGTCLMVGMSVVGALELDFEALSALEDA
jgi:hypothetical protein